MPSVPINFLLNVIHGFFSLIYFGAVLIFGLFGPKLSKLSEGTVSDLMLTVFPNLMSFIEASGMITIVFGAGEFFFYMIGYYRNGGIIEVEKILFSTGWGLCVFIGGILGIIGFSMGLYIASNFEKLFKLYKSLDPSVADDIRVTQSKIRLYSVVGLAFLTLTVIFMVLAVSFLPLPKEVMTAN
ncbi:hypothetical protein EWF20_01560 [Sulfolobus sp. S-194]|uniref:hypothetical protein n=1 Tax=Sulfolobus sp. S-194 TaxID=2512240 RepID=UPI0014370CB6|nr:hypothetical protein [Sulfolobus sp. S-194]QIW22974.1 hypothetical protein EWF20_01560 [Sulfolobus sp. S-194]